MYMHLGLFGCQKMGSQAKLMHLVAGLNFVAENSVECYLVHNFNSIIVICVITVTYSMSKNVFCQVFLKNIFPYFVNCLF